MNHWPFIAAAYGITIIGSVIIALLSYRAMRHAEDAAEKVSRR